MELKAKIAYNGWGLTKFKKYQMKKIKEAFFKFCLSPCYKLLFFSPFFFSVFSKIINN